MSSSSLHQLRSEVSNLLQLAFPSSSGEGSNNNSNSNNNDDAAIIKSTVAKIKELLLISENDNNDDGNNNNNNEDLVDLCTSMLDRLQNTKAAFDYIDKRVNNNNNNKNTTNTETTATAAAAVDFDLLLNSSSEEQEENGNNNNNTNESPDDVVTILCDRIVQLEKEKQALSRNCSLLSTHLRNARSSMRDTSRKMELQCWRSLEEVTELQNRIDMIKQQTNTNSHLHFSPTASHHQQFGIPSSMTLLGNETHHYQPGVIMNVASTSTTNLINSENTENSPNRFSNNKFGTTMKKSVGTNVAENETINTTAANSPSPSKQKEGDDNNKNNSPASSSRRRSTKSDVLLLGSSTMMSRQADDESQEELEKRKRMEGEKSAALMLSSISDPLDKIYMQSYPSLGIGMILQSLAVVFKREYDVHVFDSDSDDNDQEDNNSNTIVNNNNNSSVATNNNKNDENNNNSTNNNNNNKLKSDPQQQFEEACQQFQLALRKDLLPLVESLPILKNQMGLLVGSTASMRADYVTKCLAMKMKPNSGVMKALTAIAMTDRRRIRAFDCSNFLVGDLGVAALCGSVIESMYRLERLDLRSNNLHSNGIRVLCSLLRKHPSIVEIDLRGNPVGRAGAKMLLSVAAEVPRIEKIVIDDKAVEDPLRERIKKELERNSSTK